MKRIVQVVQFKVRLFGRGRMTLDGREDET